MIGLGEGETFLASAIPAFLRETRTVMQIENGEIVTIDADGATVTDADGEPREREIEEVTWDEDAAERGGYPTFMMKEIHEQPDAVAETITDRLPELDEVDLSELDADPEQSAADLRRIVIVACGTSYHAGLVGRYAIEAWARIPVEMDVASEYRYRDPVVGPDDLVDRDHPVGRDRRHAGRDAAGARARRPRARDHQRDGQPGDPRRGLGPLHPRRPRDRRRRHEDLHQPGRGDLPARPLDGAGPRARSTPARITELIARAEGAAAQDRGDDRDAPSEQVRAIARSHYEGRFFLYLGRHIGLPVCLEGALKMKEISYIPSDAYAAGEMKHGPIALLDETTPVVCVATDSPVLEKVLSNMAEVRARGADVIAIATEGSEQVCRRRRPDALRPADRLDPAADPRRDPAAAARLPHGPPARAQRRPAAEPGEDRHRRVADRAPGRASVPRDL